jgi:hypothetical protein
LYRFVKEDIILDTRTKDHMPVIRREIQEDWIHSKQIGSDMRTNFWCMKKSKAAVTWTWNC